MQNATKAIRNALDQETTFALTNILVPFFMTLFFLESLRVFIGLVYFQNLSTMSLGLSVLYVLLLLSPVVTPLFVQIGLRRAILLTSTLIVAFRTGIVLAQVVSTEYTLPSAGAVVFFFGIYLTLSISSYIENRPTGLLRSEALTIGLVMGISLDMMLRMLGNTWDLSVGPMGPLITTILIILAIVVLVMAHITAPGIRLPTPEEVVPVSGWNRAIAGVCLGNVFFLCLSFFLYPNVIARWTASSFELAVIGIVSAQLVYVLSSQHPSFHTFTEQPVCRAVAGLILFVGTVDLAIIHSPLTGLTSAAALFASFMIISMSWTDLERARTSLSQVAVFHTIAMATLLIMTVFYVLSLVGGQILPILAGRAPHLMLLSASITVFALAIQVFRTQSKGA